MTKKLKEYLTSVIFLIFGIFLIFFSGKMDIFIENDVGPSFMPKLVGITLTILSIAKFILAVNRKDKEMFSDLLIDRGGIYSIVLVFVYFLILEKVGFILSTILYLFIQIEILNKYDEQNIKVKILVSLFVPIIIYFLFTRAFQLMLPAGMLG
ncbi:tripartite tricarboxylate transporter TctB family protein [Anaerosphaera multitolerans]|uniref:Tripartite tricarboxylate transporter TctB family protein n=1 Tax=Anaerosphaera multitolerans TaxID=2487351 RepID=A0A437S9H1_9FIRM|nr:tripartite tricarboxylate transporter TctB family protein [Anaerosphaera multitolerans]RVU55541.1 tripartite tricarboxylate transporter TctB family protein [Anaerosphaera multitolerans]